MHFPVCVSLHADDAKVEVVKGGVIDDVLVDDWPCVPTHVEHCDVAGVGDCEVRRRRRTCSRRLKRLMS